MHYLVRLIVEAEDAEEALERASSYADDLVELQEFDWYNMENGRWGESTPHKLTSEDGRKLVEEGMKYNREEFDRAMKHVRFMVENFTDDEIYNNDFGTKEERAELYGKHEDIHYLSRYQMHAAGGYGMSYVFAEGNVWGGRVENDNDLSAILSGNIDNYWVVPVDFHN